MKIPNYLIPRFQQGSWVSNTYSNTINPAVLNQVLGAPRDQGFDEQMQVFNFQRQLSNDAFQREQAEINNRVREQQLLMQQERMELQKTEMELRFQKEYADPNFGFNILPADQDRFNQIAASYNATELPSDIHGYGEYSRNIMKMSRDPRIREMQERSILFSKLDDDLKSYRDQIRKAELKPDVFDVESMKSNYADISRQISEFGKFSGDDAGWMDSYYNIQSAIEGSSMETTDMFKKQQELNTRKAELGITQQEWEIKFLEDEENRIREATKDMTPEEELQYRRNLRSKKTSAEKETDQQFAVRKIMESNPGMTWEEAFYRYKQAGKTPDAGDNTYSYNGVNVDDNSIKHLNSILPDGASAQIIDGNLMVSGLSIPNNLVGAIPGAGNNSDIRNALEGINITLPAGDLDNLDGIGIQGNSLAIPLQVLNPASPQSGGSTSSGPSIPESGTVLSGAFAGSTYTRTGDTYQVTLPTGEIKYNVPAGRIQQLIQ